MTHEQLATVLNNIFPGIEAHSGYLGNCCPLGKYDDRLFRIFTKIDIGGIRPLDIDIPAGDVDARTTVRCVRIIMALKNTMHVTPSAAQMLNAVQYGS